MTPAWRAGERPGLVAQSRRSPSPAAPCEIRSPAVSSMSSSRPGGSGVTCCARSMQLVGGVAHRGDHDDHVVPGLPGGHDALRDPLDALGVGDRGAAVLLHDEPHACRPLRRSGCPARLTLRQGLGAPGTVAGPERGADDRTGDARRTAAAGTAARWWRRRRGVHARGVRRSFGPVHAVQGIDLDAPPGQVTALVGPNGAGKTTLMLVLATLLEPDAGEVRVAGFDPVTQAADVRARMGWSPDVFGLYDNLSCTEYLEVMAAAYDVPRHARADRARQLLTAGPAAGEGGRPGAQPVPGPEAAARAGPRAGARPGGAAAGRAGVRAGPAQPGRAARPAAALRRRGPRGGRVQPHPVRPGGGRRPGGVRGRRPDRRAAQGRRAAGGAVAADVPAALAGPGCAAPGAGAGERGLGGRRARGVDVEVVGGERTAARLLSELVAAGVPISAFAPLGGALEATYLDLVEGQR